MNTIVFGSPRLKVTQRLRHVHPFCPPLRAPTDAPRPPLRESATAGNRSRKRAQQLPTTAHKRVGRPSKRARTDTSSPTDSSQASGGAPSDATSQDASSSHKRVGKPSKRAPTQLATQSNTLQEEEQEEELQQANAENTAEKPSGNKATIVKNTAQLSKIPHYISHPLSQPLS
ncbi:hypothetical protein HO173_010297 [Letharia columbiana]|uniref:Uncharacterized protein n=1 Tax=Letharia columbiana TaxID=112416 RepID=A0A8H6FN33_9LECA|nr:uncharacterized protein HO173_010297 [Letharia columbiana]KAF6231545.1 hypothetical protein HO173_010297 [Letharia columbiana]